MSKCEDKIPTNNQNGAPYQIFNKESIEIFAESNGITNIDQNVFPLLSEDAAYRLMELVSNAFHITKHCKRNKLACDDINNALRWSDTPQLYGYGRNCPPFKEVFIEEANIFTIEDEKVNLDEISGQIINKKYKAELISESPQYKIGWLESKFKTETSNLDPMKTFSFLSDAIVGSDMTILHIALQGLSSNSHLQHILNPITKFLANNITKSGHKFNIQRQLLLALRFLAINHSLQVTTEPHLSLLLNSLLHSIIGLNQSSVDENREWNSEHLNLRCFAARILSEIVQEWSSSFTYNKLFNRVIRNLTDTLDDLSKPYYCHYGAILGIDNLGFDVVISNYHLLSKYLISLQQSLNDVKRTTDYQSRLDGQRVYSILCEILSRLIIQLRNLTLEGKDGENCNTLYKEIYSIFGDSIAIRIPTNTDKLRELYYVPKNETNIFYSNTQTGEQLLDAFYDCDNKIEDDLQSDINMDSNDEKSNESEKDTRSDGDLLVKSTISDPTFGIKLTIRKVRRSRCSSEDEQIKTNKKRKKQKVRHQIENVFERIDINEEVKVKGTINKQIEGKRISMPLFEPTRWYKLSKQLKNTGRPSLKQHIKKTWKNRLNSCSLYLTMIDKKFLEEQGPATCLDEMRSDRSSRQNSKRLRKFSKICASKASLRLKNPSG